MSHHILQITGYPIRVPRHGGQIRAHSTRRALESAGHQVTTFGIFDGRYYPGESADIDLADVPHSSVYSKYWQISDFVGGQTVAVNPALYEQFVARLKDVKSTLIMLEEPWLGSAVLRARREGHLAVPLIYNSYNVEHEAKRVILNELGAPEANEIAGEIRSLEQNLAAAAELSTATTEADAAIIRKWTYKSVVVARNGTAKRNLQRLRNILPDALSPNWRYLLFVGSGHPPNVRGLCDLVLRNLNCLEANERIVVVGSVCDPVYSWMQSQNSPYVFRDRLSLLGQVSEIVLSCLLSNAAGILLPIPFGGGSNLKTAEALVANKVIVATEAAFRGYEHFLTQEGVFIANEKAEFRGAMRRAFEWPSSDRLNRSSLEELYWEKTLEPITDAILRLG